MPVFLNSPMAIDVVELYVRWVPYHRLSAAACAAALRDVTLVRSVDESKALNQRRGPMIIVAGAGMITGGRILHHLRAFGDDPRTTILIAGHQAAGTRGADLLAGAASVKIHGAHVPIRAEVVISPASATSPVLRSVSHATRAFGSCARHASSTASEIWSAILSGWPCVTDSEVKSILVSLLPAS